MTPYEQQLADIRVKIAEFPEHDPIIRLSDVLLAFEIKRTKELNGEWGNNYHVTFELVDGEALMAHGPVDRTNFWNLRTDDLTKQSPETVAFIHSLLCV